jgi:hypothetical protein
MIIYLDLICLGDLWLQSATQQGGDCGLAGKTVAYAS